MNITYDYYRIFYYVCRYGSFTKAALMLGNNQPNITRAMNNLESQLGVVLFVRSKKGVTLTDEGERLYQRVKLAHEQISLAEKEIDDAKNMEAGVVIVGASEVALHEILVPVLTDFKKKYPKIIIKITNESSPSAIKSVQEDKVDFSVVTSPIVNMESCDCKKISEFTEFPIIKKELLAKTAINSIADIAKHSLIMLAEGTATRRFYEDLFAAYNLVLNPQMIAATADQILTMVRAGFGIGFLPESMIIDDDSIVKIDIKEQIPKRDIVLVSKENRRLNHATRRLMAELRNNHH